MAQKCQKIKSLSGGVKENGQARISNAKLHRRARAHTEMKQQRVRKGAAFGALRSEREKKGRVIIIRRLHGPPGRSAE